MGTGRSASWAAASIALLAGLPGSAKAVEVSGGVSVGGILVGTAPRLAVSPHASVSWSRENGFLFALQNMGSILPATSKHGVGFYNQTSAAIGYASDERNFSIGPTLSAYSFVACGPALCGRVLGVAPGAHAQVNIYFYGRLGVSLNASLDWIGGGSLVLPGGLATMVVAGPVVRWMSE
jgi:hypothetical protein